MKRIFIFIIASLALQTLSAATVYNFNFDQGGKSQQSVAVKKVNTDTVVSHKAETKAEDQYYGSAGFKFSVFNTALKFDDGAFDYSLIAYELSLLIPLFSRSHLVLGLGYSGKSAYSENMTWSDYTEGTSWIYSLGLEHELPVVTNISMHGSATFFYNHTSFSGDNFAYYRTDEKTKLDVLGLRVECGPKFRVGKTTFGLTLGGVVGKMRGELSSVAMTGRLFIGRTI